MSYFKYVPDGWVGINGAYNDSFANFATDCATLSLTNPVAEGYFFEYQPSLGRSYIVPAGVHQGTHSPWDGLSYPAMQAIIDAVGDFVAEKTAREQPEE